MRVLHITHWYPLAIGALGKYIPDLSEGLAAHGHQVDVLTSRSLNYHSWLDDQVVWPTKYNLDVRERR